MIQGFRGRIVDFSREAGPLDAANHLRYYEDGLLVIENGYIRSAGDFAETARHFPQNLNIADYRDCFIFPGFIDAHVHSVQTQAMASYGRQLLDWLEKYIFPNEKKFSDAAYAEKHTSIFLNQLLKNGTTTAFVYPAVFDVSVEKLFDQASRLNMRLISGKTWMDRNAPDFLIEEPEKSYASSKRLIEKWHQKKRLHYAVTPRYAVTSSPESLELASVLLREFDNLYVQTHISENKKEVALANSLHPANHHYLDVYDSYNLLTSRTLLGHGIYLNDDELKRIAEVGASIVHCPTSNLFLGSGLFNYLKVLDYRIPIAVGSDVGAGTSFSMLQNLHDAYKISALQGIPMLPEQAFYFITLGGARALKLDDHIGNFDAGKEADFVVIDPSQNELLKYRLDHAETLQEILFSMIILGDDRIVKETCIMGEPVLQKLSGIQKDC